MNAKQEWWATKRRYPPYNGDNLFVLILRESQKNNYPKCQQDG